MTSKEPDKETGEGPFKFDMPSAQLNLTKLENMPIVAPSATSNKNAVYNKVPLTCKNDSDMNYLEGCGIPESHWLVIAQIKATMCAHHVKATSHLSFRM